MLIVVVIHRVRREKLDEFTIYYKCTGCFKAKIYTLTGDYDKYTVCTEKIVVDLFSVHMEILFDGNRSEKNNCLYSKNLNWKFRPFFP